MPYPDWRNIAQLRFPELMQLYRPEAASHVAHFYQDDRVVIENIVDLARKALDCGSSVVLVATKDHLREIFQRIGPKLDLESLRAKRRYIAADAAQALSRLMLHGCPDETKFNEVIGATIIQAAKRSTNDFVLAFGEMVALLCAEDKPDAAWLLERFWNRLACRQPLSLYCVYSLDCLDTERTFDHIMRLSAEHNLVVPSELVGLSVKSP